MGGGCHFDLFQLTVYILAPIIIYNTHACSYEVMQQCWREDPEERPTFSQLSSIVDKLLTSISGYTELSMVLKDTSQEVEQLSKLLHVNSTVQNILYPAINSCIIIYIHVISNRQIKNRQIEDFRWTATTPETPN